MAGPISTSAAAAVGPAARPGMFSYLSDDIVLNILAKLDGDPREWARASCVSARFDSLIRTVLYRSKCSRSIPSASDLAAAAGGWAALHKLSFCCPGLLHAGVLLENSDFGLEREIGPDDSYPLTSSSPAAAAGTATATSTSRSSGPPPAEANAVAADCWSLFDDLYFDAEYDASESHLPPPATEEAAEPVRVGNDQTKASRRQWVGPVKAHLATGAWNLSRERGIKLLASRFRGDSLYICDWPGCVHAEEKRKYMLFRGMFKNFKRSRVWRTINDGNRAKIALDCAFCSCKETWDLHSAFCLRRVYGFHDDGEPVVRAYVCENGHVSGAWTERPMYT